MVNYEDPVWCGNSAHPKPQQFRGPEEFHGGCSQPYLGHPDACTLNPMNTSQLQFLMLLFAGWVNRSQQDVIKSLEQENRVLHE